MLVKIIMIIITSPLITKHPPTKNMFQYSTNVLELTNVSLKHRLIFRKCNALRQIN